MNHSEFQLRGVSDQRLAMHATSPLPAWLWSVDGSHVLWANPVGARLFGAANSTVLARKTFGPADSHRRQVAQLANRLPASGALRLERLRGFGAPLGSLVTCACIRISFCDGSHGILIAVPEPVGRTMPLVERLQRLVEGIDAPIAAFDRDGRFVGANTAAHSLPSPADLTGPGLDEARLEALKQGRVELPVGPNRLVIQRVGVGAEAGLVVLMATPNEPEQEPHVTAPDHPTSDSEDQQPEVSGEAPAEFALIEAPADPAASARAEGAPPLSDDGHTAETSQAVDSPQASTPIDEPDAPAPEADAASHEPSPYIEPVADEPQATDEPASSLTAPPWLEELAQHPRRVPLRFLWQMDSKSRFSLDSEEFSYLIGAHATSGFGRPWGEIADSFGLDPDGRVLKAFATRDTWSGITLDWPVDGGDNLPIELAGLPVFDRARNFAGYRGFGVCRDLDGLARLVALRRYELSHPPPLPQALSADIVTVRRSAEPPEHIHALDPDPTPAPTVTTDNSEPTTLEIATSEISQATDSETTVETPANVVPFPLIGDAKSPALTPGENRAFNELARQLAERLERNKPVLPSPANADELAGSIGSDPPKTVDTPDISDQVRWLTPAEPPAKGDSRDRSLLDLLPTGILIYRLDRLLYANPAFLQRVGYESLHALEDAGGLDALYVEPGTSAASSTSDAGTLVTISAGEAAPEQVSTEARLHNISWDGDAALALICSAAPPESAVATNVEPVSEPDTASDPSPAGHANAEELATILDTTADGILMFDAEGAISSCNRSAEALFGHDGAELVRQNFFALFAPESQPAVRDYLESVGSADLASLLDQGRDVLAFVRGGGLIPVSVMLGRTQAQGPNFFAMFRDQSQVRKSESELREARRLAERAANAKADMLSRISHEVRAPLNAILGFAEVMIGERFGALGNERYGEYLKDIRASGERVIAIINDLLDLSRVETGKLDLSFTDQNLNDLVEQCVAAMQPQANRGRIIIRTSLAHTLPSVVADAYTLRQIMLNLIGNSIRLANAGGQVIVSTALSDFGDVVLRVRDTGHGMNDNEVAAALQPFRSPAPSEQTGDDAGLNLSLTKALVEANGAHFQIRTGPHSGTLIEVVFSRAAARA